MRGLSAVLMLLVPVGAMAKLPVVREAEECAVVCRAGDVPQENIWARGGKVTPAGWGQAAGDSITWPVTLSGAHRGLRFGVRYSRAQANPERALRLVVDGGRPVALKVPATGSADVFETVAADLPALAAGRHSFRILCPEGEVPVSVDTLLLFEGPVAKLPARLARTVVAQDAHFQVRITPNAPLRLTPQRVLAEFERIHAYYSGYMGWAPDEMIGVNIVEKARWPEPGATAFQNEDGVFFRAEGMDRDQGNWLHEMTHMFYVGHFPRWFDEPSVRALTTLVWAPALCPTTADVMTGPVHAHTEAAGKAAWENADGTYDSIEPVLDALIVHYGPDVFRRFFHACADAGAKGDLDFRPNRWLTKAEIVKYMSLAAGEDTEPLFRRWKGFAAAE